MNDNDRTSPKPQDPKTPPTAPLPPSDIKRFLQESRQRLDNVLKSIFTRKWLYRFMNQLFSLLAVIAGWADRIKKRVVELVLKLPAPHRFKRWFKNLFSILHFKGIVDFFKAKMYSLRNAPHNIKAIQVVEETLESATRKGLDLKKHFPDLIDKAARYKNDILQHSFFNEYSKNFVERLLAMPFSFKHSIAPVLPDHSPWYKLFNFLEKRHVTDLILVEPEQRISVFNDPQEKIRVTRTIAILNEAVALKKSGHRLFIIGHHESYLGPYFVRSVLRKLKFVELVGNCNTIVGPRMFSNIILQRGARNVGNLFLTLPSRRTTEVKEKGLEKALQKTARRTQFLIKMPNAGLKLISLTSYDDFMNNFVHSTDNPDLQRLNKLDPAEKNELIRYFQDNDIHNNLADLDREDYDLFQSIMYEPYLLFPEGSRSYQEKNGDVTLKYFNPRFMQAYMRPGDIILPISLVGGSDIAKGVWLHHAPLGLSVDQPREVTPEMIENFKIEGVNLMRDIAALPNIKKVHFDEDIQAGKKRKN